jgi:hypothetical protein
MPAANTPGRHDRDTHMRPSVRRMHSGDFDVCGVRDLAPPMRTRKAAETWLACYLQTLPTNRRPALRICLNCNTDFDSAGAHNRLCDGCRGQE